MISIAEAYQEVVKNTFPLSKELRDVKDATSCFLAEDVIAPIHMPPFRQSAMDGYALNIHSENTYALIGEIKAGDEDFIQLKAGEAVRIFTGAAVPDSANVVVMQEKVVAGQTSIEIQTAVSKEENIRPKGEQVSAGDVALSKGTRLTAAAIGFLSSLGITKVNVIKKPSVAIVSTGNELIAPGTKLPLGKIYESNTTMLDAAMHSICFNDTKIFKVKDSFEDTLNLFSDLFKRFDLIVVTGGISVGDYDFVGKALGQLKVDECFYKVKQKPGKPLYFGKKNSTIIFALPGNPAAALSCFYIYVRTCLELLAGNKEYQLVKIEAKSNSSFVKKGDRPQFLKAILTGETVDILEGQSSAMLQTFALANALVFVPEEVGKIGKGDFVEVIPLTV